MSKKMLVSVLLVALSNMYSLSAIGQEDQVVEPAIQTELPPEPLAGIEAVEGVSVRIWASTPMVMDPVSFCIDEKGRVLVAESFRQEHGVEDNRSQPYWLLDDLASQTVEDRLAKYHKWAHKRENGMNWYTEKEDRIRIVEDTNQDGFADKVTIFADRFDEPLSGTGAGLIARDGKIWYACIPHLWQLEDQDNDGIADQRTTVHSGFGVRDALRGHDMHGLVWGPDGRLYWSIGDRGYNVISKEGRRFADPRAGAVFRCEPDGSELEVFYYGLRNPQELAFDRYGYLFTGDNNSDAGDKARMTYIAEGGQTGWEMNYQSVDGENVRGPWVQEGLWETDHPERPAWSLPPLKHVSSGPSGLTTYPGQGLPERYKDHLFMCDFTGSPTNSSVLAMQMVPDGAGFRVEDVHPFVSGILCTDVDFNWDGSMVVSDWVQGWEGSETGRLIVLSSDEQAEALELQKTAQLIAQGIKHRETSELLSLLSHPDMRIRQRAQFVLADRGETSIQPLAVIAQDANAEQMARIHSLWCLGMIARYGDYQVGDASHPLAAVMEVTEDPDPEIRSQAARVLGDEAYQPAYEQLISLIFDEEPRVVYHATMGLGQIGDPLAVDAILEMLWANDNEDRWLRHAGVMALVRIDDRAGLVELLGDPMPSVRMAALLALRRLEDPAVARLLRDSDPMIAAEAARAINDKPIASADIALADVLPSLVRTSIDASPVYERSSQQDLYTVQLERFDNVPFATSHELETLVAFDREPDEILSLQTFVAPDNQSDQFVSQMTGRFVVSDAGEYRFALCSDDSAVLSIWPEEQPDQKQFLSRVDDWVDKNTWDQQPNQISEPIELTEGTAYILEARHCDRSGKDHLAIAWQKPDGRWQRPIGNNISDPTGTATRTEMAVTRRALAATLRTGDAHRIKTVAALALDPTQPAVIRREAIDVLAQWPKPRPRDLVQGRYRPVVTERNTEQWREAMTQIMPALTQSHPVVAVPAQQIAAAHNIALDTSVLQKALEDTQAPFDQRQTMLRLLCREAKTRQPAIDTALLSSDPNLKAEAIRLLAQYDQEAALPIVLEAINGSHLQQKRAAIEALGLIENIEAEQVLLELLQNIETKPSSLHLDILMASQQKGGAAIAPHLTHWQKVIPSGFAATYGLASEGGDPVRGRELVFYHAGASCLRCHLVEGVGGESGPSLDGVASRLTRDQLLSSLLMPQELIADGYGASSAMPAMHQYLSPIEMRDVMAYLMTLESNEN